ncbi:hypothetical protein [Paenibacillus sp. VTT E-133291]|uniref:hypothetical protein n=1 Tax=Paenibacillus sp. VTT E-133291 TaxID=1986223 RepID=UPI000B9FBE52|nr:hypothetical protein [Paenibacillus sp. VTT E-133291]OZQ97349.1 hypothetical protein CA598_06035 [Paenibacillus sp. VTT E-133291]
MYEKIKKNEDLTQEATNAKKEASERHAEVVQIAREAFEVEFPKIINDEYINNYLRQNLKRGEKEIEISIRWNHTGHFYLETAILRHFYKYSIFDAFYFRQKKLKNLQIKKLIKRAKYEDEIQPTPQEIVENSKVVETLISKLQASGYQAEMVHKEEIRKTSILKVKFI